MVTLTAGLEQRGLGPGQRTFLCSLWPLQLSFPVGSLQSNPGSDKRSQEKIYVSSDFTSAFLLFINWKGVNCLCKKQSGHICL